MSPLPQEGTVLEWTDSGNGNVSRAEAGPYILLAWKQGWWEVRVNGNAVHKEHDEGDMRSGRLAAESAARDLICTALAAFADQAPQGFDVTASNAGFVRLDGRYMEPGVARRLALALLKASEEASE